MQAKITSYAYRLYIKQNERTLRQVDQGIGNEISSGKP